MKFRYTKALATVAILAVASCSDNKWEPGPDVNPGAMTVFFEPLSTYDIIVEPDDSRLIPVTVSRARNEKAATVAITSTCPEEVIVPETVEFEAGEQSKTIFIDIVNMPSKSSGAISLSLPEEMTTPYGAGNAAITMNVTISGAWILLADDVQVIFNNTYGRLYNSSLYILDGTNNFKFPNFLNSGLDFVFTVNEPGIGNLRYVPIKNYIDVHDYFDASYEYNGWFLHDDANNTYPEWSPDGTLPFISLIEFDSDYSYINFTEGFSQLID